MGTACLDLRYLGKDVTKATPEEIAAQIESHHYIANTSSQKKAYDPRFQSIFCKSEVFNTTGEMLGIAKARIEALRMKNTPSKPETDSSEKPSHDFKVTKKQQKDKKKANNQSIGQLLGRLASAGEWTPKTSRDVFVFFWDSRMEEAILNATAQNPFENGGFVLWDFHRWRPVQRHRGKEQCSLSDFLERVGLETMTESLHNAANDS